jgi:hypothetical protein
MQLADSQTDTTFQTDIGATGVTPDWVTALSNLAAQGLNLVGQLKLQDMNLKLIGQGKAPLTAYQMQSMAPQLNVGLASSAQTTLFYVLGGGAAVILLASLMKRSRR